MFHKERNTCTCQLKSSALEHHAFPFPGQNRGILSPRTGQLLKTLREKLESAQQKKRSSNLENNQKKSGTGCQRQTGELLLPGIFLVRQISPRQNRSAQVSSFFFVSFASRFFFPAVILTTSFLFADKHRKKERTGEKRLENEGILLRGMPGDDEDVRG